VPDDTPNRVIDWTSFASNAVLDNGTAEFSRGIEYLGDVDVFQFTVNAASSVTIQSQGSMDTVGTLMEANGKAIVTNDDVSGTNTNFGITRTLQPGTYYVLVAPWDPNVTGSYRLVMSAQASAPSTPTTTETNYSDLWWSTENGWGINLAHQGDIIFGTLYTYETNGTPVWWAMSSGNKQPDGSFSGTLYRGAGTVYSSPTWSPSSSTAIGTMRLSFDTASTGTLIYTVNGISVTKSIRRFQFSTPTTCTWTNGDRTGATNYQDLWWNPSESGWGLNIAHQGSTVFALLYVYDSNGQPTWFSMSNGALVDTRTYTGRLYRSTGPAFNASPWTPSSASEVGQMTLIFNDGETGALIYTVNGTQVTKPIRRTVFSNPKPICTSP
jgi:lysyl endopeptidase